MRIERRNRALNNVWRFGSFKEGAAGRRHGLRLLSKPYPMAEYHDLAPFLRKQHLVHTSEKYMVPDSPNVLDRNVYERDIIPVDDASYCQRLLDTPRLVTLMSAAEEVTRIWCANLPLRLPISIPNLANCPFPVTFFSMPVGSRNPSS